MSKKIGCYIHIPFCKRRCDYCAFLSCVGDEQLKESYVNALCREIAEAGKKAGDVTISTIYFGGGTPSVLSAEQIKRIVDVLNDAFALDTNERTIECNPSDVNADFLKALRSMGFDRLSMGVQTLRDDILEKLNRRTTVAEVQNALTTASEYFDNISVDLMLGLPDLTPMDIKKSVDQLTSFSSVKHVSTYCLACEEGTPLEKKVADGQVFLPTDDQTAAQYEYVVKLLKAKGFERYEVSNFCLSGYKAKHNSSYWDRTEYYGFGAGASGFINNARYKNVSDIARFISLAEKGESVTEEYNVLTESDVIEEIIMLGLRTEKGIDLSRLDALGYDIFSEKEDELERLGQFLTVEEGRIAIKPQYALVQNYIISELI